MRLYDRVKWLLNPQELYYRKFNLGKASIVESLIIMYSCICVNIYVLFPWYTLISEKMLRFKGFV